MEATKKHAVNAQHAEEWYRKASAGDPPQPEALFQLARIHHEVRQDLCMVTLSRLLVEHDAEYVLTTARDFRFSRQWTPGQIQECVYGGVLR